VSDRGEEKTYVSDAQTFSLYITPTYFFRNSFDNGIKNIQYNIQQFAWFQASFAMKTRRAVVWDITHRRLVITTIPLYVA